MVLGGSAGVFAPRGDSVGTVKVNVKRVYVE